MIDPIVNLAFSMHKTPGLYALLLGSGISKSVGIPTGQEIRDDLARQVKAISGKEIPEEAGYDELLKQLGKTPAERNAILKSYFEPTPEEREQGLKVPSAAHQAIAKLVNDGYIRVILTTNFDRLLEQALANLGITPNVIRSDDMLEGAMPLRHSPITIVQLHGDYLDLRMLNTPEELSDYSDPKNHLLETIFDEYGLIVCGWSARWDTALRHALIRVKSRRYSTYWVEPFDLSSEAHDLVKHRDATPIQEAGDTFFRKLADNVDSLAKMNREHPLTIAVAVERVKKWIPDESKHIEMEELFAEETEKSYQQFTKDNDLVVVHTAPQQDSNETLLHHYASVCDIPLQIAITLCWYGREGRSDLMEMMMSRWTRLPQDETSWGNTRQIPALLLLYLGGLAALSKWNWQYIRAMIDVGLTYNGKKISLLERVNKHTALEYTIYGADHLRRHDPMSKLIYRLSHNRLGHLLPDDVTFRRNFNLFEMILALLSVHSRPYLLSHNMLYRYYSAKEDSGEHIETFWTNGAKQGKNWNFLNTFYGGNEVSLVEALTEYAARVPLSDNVMPQQPSPVYAEIYLNNFKR